MIIGAWLLVIAFMTLYFRNMEDRERNPNQRLTSIQGTGFTEISLSQNRQGHYLANGKINGEPVTFLLDTGATLVAIPYSMRERLGLRKGMAVPTNTANGTSTSYLTRIDLLELGDISLSDVPAGLATGLQGNEILLGMSFLADLELVQRGDSLTIRQYH
jgi:aspartyl protease family protein